MGYLEYRAKYEEIFQQHAERNIFTEIDIEQRKRIHYTYRRVQKDADRLQRNLQQYGIEQFSRIAFISELNIQAVMMLVKLAYCGYTAVLLDHKLPKSELVKLLKDSDVSAIITDGKKEELICEDGIEDAFYFRLSGTGLELYHSPDKKKVLQYPLMDDVVAIVYSSGTMSEAKGVMVRYDALTEMAVIWKDLYQTDPGMKVLLVLPYYHISGYSILFLQMLIGGEIGTIKDFNISKIPAAFHIFEPHSMSMVPKYFEVLEQQIRGEMEKQGKGASFERKLQISKFCKKYLHLNIGKLLFAPLRTKLFGRNIIMLPSGGTIKNAANTEFFLNLGILKDDFYSTTETMVPTVATCVHDNYPSGTVGKVTRLKGIHVKLKNKDENGIGEILIKTPLMMKGYFHDEKATAEAIEDGYFKTGDLGYIDKNNYLYVTGRAKDTIILSTGKKVSPLEIEQYYSDSKGRYTVASCGFTDPENSNEQIGLAVCIADPETEDQETIRKELLEKSKAAGNQFQLQKILFLKEIPMTSIGKVKRYKLKEAFEKKDEQIKTKNTAAGEQTVEAILFEILGGFVKGEYEIKLSSNLMTDLGLNSLLLIGIASEIQKRFDVNLLENPDRITTVESVITLIEEKKDGIN